MLSDKTKVEIDELIESIDSYYYVGFIEWARLYSGSDIKYEWVDDLEELIENSNYSRSDIIEYFQIEYSKRT